MAPTGNANAIVVLRRVERSFDDEYGLSGCDCDPSVGIVGCLVCDVRALVDMVTASARDDVVMECPACGSACDDSTAALIAAVTARIP